MGYLDYIININTLVFTLAIVLSFLLMSRNSRIKTLSGKIESLQNNLDQLDEQAKLIIQTDLQFTKTQEILDREIEIFYALNRLIRMIGSTLDEKEIFKRIRDPILLKLGFEKIIILTQEQNELKTKVTLGFDEETIDKFKNDIMAIYGISTKSNKPLCIPHFDDADTQFRSVMTNLRLSSLIAVTMNTKENPIGLVIAGNKIGGLPFVTGDAEIISILANQIAQSLENIKLYEEAWNAKQSLESKIKERTSELTEALDKLKKISKAKSEFLSAVSHELRTPLTSIKGYAAILSSGKLGEINSEIKTRLEKINSHSDSLTNLINELLDISRIESGKTIMKFENFRLIDSGNLLLDMLMPQLKEKEIKLDIKIPSDLEIFADKNQIERAILNLLSNAIKFTPKKGIITIRAKKVEESISIEVSDNGQGINEIDLPHVFEEFYRADNEINTKVKGTGLGLSLVKSIVSAHRGTITCESKIEKGTTFIIKLPIDIDIK